MRLTPAELTMSESSDSWTPKVSMLITNRVSCEEDTSNMVNNCRKNACVGDRISAESGKLSPNSPVDENPVWLGQDFAGTRNYDSFLNIAIWCHAGWRGRSWTSNHLYSSSF
ncbi:hypothetical protein PoB_006813500 [Plakobranchus ocellatus]|uniref:Uncharacterized protein n=1 Tax=Plakobranchus ocellatus TaxID=259542 RepID=A0AAV4DC58_9GAST|nr:hypothetical protein PoB_006813500 [Plakobranchus ocellatus]